MVVEDGGRAGGTPGTPFTLTVDKADVWSALSRLREAGVLSNRRAESTPLEIVADEEALHLGVEGQLSVALRVPARVGLEGRCLVPDGARFAEAVRRLARGPINMEHRDRTLNLSIGSFSSQWHTVRRVAEVMPLRSTVDPVEVSASALLQGLVHVAATVPASRSQGGATDAAIDFGTEVVTFTTTDRYRCAIAEVAGDLVYRSHGDPPGLVCLPWTALDQLVRLLPDAGALLIRVDPGRIAFSFDDGTVQLQRSEELFPAFRPILDIELPNVVEIDREQMLSVLSRLRVLFDPKSIQRVDVLVERDHLTFTAIDKATGEARDHLAATSSLQSGPTRLGFDLPSLAVLTATLRGEVVRLDFKESDSPCRLSSPTDPGSRYYIEPFANAPVAVSMLDD